MRLPTILALAVLLAVCPRTSVRAQDEGDSYDAPSDDSGDEGAPPQPFGDDATPPPDEDTYRDAPDPDDYDEALAPNGEWVEEPDYGRVWRPRVAVDWRPYSDGYWAWTPYGWTWISSEPWGWTFHYGHWVLGSPGWVWVPGTVWGPAYVDWVWHDGYVGWAPLPPAGHVVVVNNFVFVNEHHFCDRRIRTVIERRPPRGFDHDDWHRYRVRAPDVHRIERVAREPVHRVKGKPPETIAPSRRNTFNHGPGMRTPDGQPNRQQQDRPQRDRQDQPRGDRERANQQDRPQHERPQQQNRPQHEPHDRLPREQQTRPQADRPDRDGGWRGGHADRPSPQLRGEDRQQQRLDAHPQSQRPMAHPEGTGSPQPSQMAPRPAHPNRPSGEGHERGGGHRGEGMQHPSGGPERRRQND